MANTLLQLDSWQQARSYLERFHRQVDHRFGGQNPIAIYGAHVSPVVCDYWYDRAAREEDCRHRILVTIDDDGTVLSFVPYYINIDQMKIEAGYDLDSQVKYGDWTTSVVGATVGWRYLRLIDEDRGHVALVDALRQSPSFCADDLSPLEFRSWTNSHKTFATLEANWFALDPSFDDYVASLDKDARSDYRAVMRRNTEAGTRVDISHSFPNEDEYGPLLEAYLTYWRQKDEDEIKRYESLGVVVNPKNFVSAYHSETVFHMLRLASQECPDAVLVSRVYVGDRLVGINFGTELSSLRTSFRVFNDHLFLRYTDESLNRLVLGKFVVWQNIRHLASFNFNNHYIYNLSCGMQPYKSSFVPKDTKSSVFLPSKASPVTATDHLFASFVPPFFYDDRLITTREQMWEVRQQALADPEAVRLAQLTREVYKRPHFELTKEQFLNQTVGDTIVDRVLYDDPDKQFDPKGRSNA